MFVTEYNEKAEGEIILQNFHTTSLIQKLLQSNFTKKN